MIRGLKVTGMINIGRVLLLRSLIFCSLIAGFAKITTVYGQEPNPSAPLEDVHFSSGSTALRIPFELYNNHIYLQVRVNGSKPLSFLLDSGAPHIIDTGRARALGLKLKSVGKARGIGEGSVDAYSSTGVTFELPGVSLSGQQIGTIPFEDILKCESEVVVDETGHMRKCEPSEQRSQIRVIDGILGHDFFKRFVVEIDYRAHLLNIYAPENYKYQGTGEILHLEIEDQNVFVQARLSSAGRAPLRGRFMVDTGGAHALILTTPYIEANKLLPPLTELTKFSICGIGGYTEILIGTLSEFQLGNIKISAPVTGYSQAEKGKLTESLYDGNIGGAILRHFKVIFDQSRRRMILEPQSKE